MEHQSFPTSTALPRSERPHPIGKEIDGVISCESGTGSCSVSETRSDRVPTDDAKRQPTPRPRVGLTKLKSKKNSIVHTVKPGETLSQIAVHYYGTCKDELLQHLKSMNEIHEPDALQAGWELILPILAVDGDLGPVRMTATATDAENSQKSKAVEDIPENGTSTEDRDGKTALQSEKKAQDPFTANIEEGLAAFEKEDYRTAYEAFTVAAEHRRGSTTCSKHLQKIEAIANHHFENGLSCYRKRNYVKAIAEIEKACIPPLKVQATEYLFKSHFEIAMKKFLRYKRLGNKKDYAQARNSLNQARIYQAACPGCIDYEEIFKKTHYNNGIKYFTSENGESMDKAIEEWEKVRFIDPGYKDVTENIAQAQSLMKKLRKFKRIS